MRVGTEWSDNVHDGGNVSKTADMRDGDNAKVGVPVIDLTLDSDDECGN